MGHHGMKGMAMHRLAGMDANGDRAITRDEFVAGALRRFDAADANHDGKVTPEERRAAMKARMQEMRGRMKGMDMGGMEGGAMTPPPSPAH